MEVGIAVGREHERTEAALRDVDAELLLKLAHQCGFGRFARVHLAAGEFPQPGHRLSGRALREQDAAIDVDERHRGDKKQRLFAHSRPTAWLSAVRAKLARVARNVSTSRSPPRAGAGCVLRPSTSKPDFTSTPTERAFSTNASATTDVSLRSPKA